MQDPTPPPRERAQRRARTAAADAAPALLAAVLALSGCRSGAAAPPVAEGLVFRAVPIGLCEDYPEESRSLETVRRDMKLLREAGVRLLRVSIGWDGLEPQEGRYDWAFWDAFVDLAVRQNGVRLIPYVAYTPRWIS